MTSRGLTLGEETLSDMGLAEPDRIPDLFNRFLLDRQTRKPSAHTMKAYRQDFQAIASLITAGQPASMNVVDVNRDSMRAALAASRARARSGHDCDWLTVFGPGRGIAGADCPQTAEDQFIEQRSMRLSSEPPVCLR